MMPERGPHHIDVVNRQHLPASCDVEPRRVATVLIFVRVEAGSASPSVRQAILTTATTEPTCWFEPTPRKSLPKSERGLLEVISAWHSLASQSLLQIEFASDRAGGGITIVFESASVFFITS